MKIGSLYLRIGPVPSVDVAFFMHETSAFTFSKTGVNSQDGDRIVILFMTESEDPGDGFPTAQVPGGDLAWAQIDMSEVAYVATSGNNVLITAWWALMTATDPASPTVTYAPSAGNTLPGFLAEAASFLNADTITPIVQYDSDVCDTTVEPTLNLTGMLSNSFGIVYALNHDLTNTVDDFTPLGGTAVNYWWISGVPSSITPLGVHITGAHGVGTDHGAFAVELKHA